MKNPVRGSSAGFSGSEMWYYISDGKKTGPVDRARIDKMLSSGEIPPETQVWRKDMDSWAPANETELLSKGGSQKTTPADSVPETEEETAPKKRKFPWWIWLIVGVAVLGIAAAAWFFIFRDQEPDPESLLTYGLKDPVVFENDACAFIIDEIGEKGDYLELDVRCVNKTEDALSFSWNNISINGYMFDPLWYVYVYGNSTTKSSITFPLSTLENYHLLPADQIRFVLAVYNEDQLERQIKESSKHIVHYFEDFETVYPYNSYHFIAEYPEYLFAKDVWTDDDGRPYYVSEDMYTVYFDEILDSAGQPVYAIRSTVSHYSDFYNDRYTRPYYFTNTGTTVYYDGFGFAFVDEETGKNYYYTESGKPAYYGNGGMPEYYEGEISQELLEAGKTKKLEDADGNFLVHEEFAIYPRGKAAAEVTYPDRITGNAEQIYWQGEKGGFVILGGEMNVSDGYVVNTYIENNSDNYVYLAWKDARVNGFNTYPNSITALRPNSRSYRNVVIPRSVLTENKITNVEQIDFQVYAVGENLSVPLYPIVWEVQNGR